MNFAWVKGLGLRHEVTRARNFISRRSALVQPDNVVAQTESSIVYGLGLALTERITVKDGVVQQSNFYDYQVPRMRDVPEMHVRLMPTPNPPTGVGQMATPLIAPAIASAVHAATKKRLRQTPFTPERVRAALSA